MENPLQHFWSRKPESEFSPVILTSPRKRINYDQLEKQSYAFATLLHEAGCTKEDRLCFMTSNYETALLIMAGIMKAGCTGIPVNPRSSSQDIHSVMVNADSNWLFTDESASSYPDPLLIETGEISLGWLGKSAKIPRNISPEFVTENLAQYSKKHSLADAGGYTDNFKFFLSGDDNQLEVGHLAEIHLRLFVDQLNSISGGLRSGRTGTFLPESGCSLFRELFGSAKQRGQFYLMPEQLLNNSYRLHTRLSEKKIGHLFINAAGVDKLTKGLKKDVTPHDGIKEIVIWGKRPSQENLANLETCFPKCMVTYRSAGKGHNIRINEQEEKKSIISRAIFPPKSLDHWEKLFGLSDDVGFHRTKHTDYIREIKAAYLNYWRKVEEKNLLTVQRQQVKVSFHNDI